MQSKDDRKSTTGYIFLFDETPILWCSKKEAVVTLSSCDVGNIVASLCVCQDVWLMSQLKELGSEEGDVVKLMVDNISTINLAKNPIEQWRSKHIEMRFRCLREIVSERRLRLRYCRIED